LRAATFYDLPGIPPVRLCEYALRALARGEAYRVGPQIVTTCLSKANEGSIPDALPALVSVAMPIDRFMPTGGFAGDPEPLLAAYRLFPDLVLSAIRNLLRNQNKHPRIEACNSISILDGTDPTFGLNVINDLIDSLGLPDDPYGEHSSGESQVTSVLAQIMQYHPQSVDRAIQQKTPYLADDAKVAVRRL
jgi:hypothetical protein